jgi:DNA-binding CsgD family transcriptional regulator
MACTGIVSPYFKEYFHRDGHRVPISLSGVRIIGSHDRKVCCIVDLSENVMSIPEDIGAQPSAGAFVNVRGALLAAISRYALTNREGEVLLELLRGRSNHEIAGALFISTATACDHVSKILRKMNIRTRNQVFPKVMLPGDDAVVIGDDE